MILRIVCRVIYSIVKNSIKLYTFYTTKTQIAIQNHYVFVIFFNFKAKFTRFYKKIHKHFTNSNKKTGQS